MTTETDHCLLLEKQKLNLKKSTSCTSAFDHLVIPFNWVYWVYSIYSWLAEQYYKPFMFEYSLCFQICKTGNNILLLSSFTSCVSFSWMHFYQQDLSWEMWDKYHLTRLAYSRKYPSPLFLQIWQERFRWFCKNYISWHQIQLSEIHLFEQWARRTIRYYVNREDIVWMFKK